MRTDIDLPDILRVRTAPAWLECVERDLDALLIDHAYCEQKAASMALALIGKYPGRSELAHRMVALAHEELHHFDRVFQILERRGVALTGKRKDPYVQALRQHVRRGFGVERQLCDELLVCSLVEARSCERFGVLADGLSDRELASFFRELNWAEARHHELFVELAAGEHPGGRTAVLERLSELSEREAEILTHQPIEPRMH
ncbi:MAG: tRNA isopentenyl-2-thiomethyl-A-37 hydroxylase MiaE [Planctomycetota bacterium]